MKRFSSLLADTWWVWIVIFVFGVTLGIVLHPLFYSSIPIGMFSFLYFGIMRYDEEGNAREGF